PLRAAGDAGPRRERGRPLLDEAVRLPARPLRLAGHHQRDPRHRREAGLGAPPGTGRTTLAPARRADGHLRLALSLRAAVHSPLLPPRPRRAPPARQRRWRGVPSRPLRLPALAHRARSGASRRGLAAAAGGVKNRTTLPPPGGNAGRPWVPASSTV